MQVSRIQQQLLLTAINIDINEVYMQIDIEISQSWRAIAPFWPLKSLIACNPLQGFEDLSFSEAVTNGTAYFAQKNIPKNMENINRETIKWCQTFFDNKQATINMPYRKLGLYKSWRKLVCFDSRLNATNSEINSWLIALPESAEETIDYCLSELGIFDKNSVLFLTLLLTTLPGWASYIKYHNSITQTDYLAMRIVITFLLWKNANNLLAWHAKSDKTAAIAQIKTIINAEQKYRAPLLKKLSEQIIKINEPIDKSGIAQLVFCIDVRSEPFRRALESQGNYQTYGFAGFFGVPVEILNKQSGTSHSSCPVLLTAKHTVKEMLVCSDDILQKINQRKKQATSLNLIYQSLKYTFTTPFALVEMLGVWSGLLMLLKTIAPNKFKWLKQKMEKFFQSDLVTQPLINDDDNNFGIIFEDQCAYAESALRMINLTENFSKLVVFCGHGSETENNAYATAFDCGACGGHRGGINAKILAAILNDANVRNYLYQKNINIPEQTIFIAAEHNTTTDEVVLFTDLISEDKIKDQNLIFNLNRLKNDLNSARQSNNQWRCKQMNYIGSDINKNKFTEQIKKRSSNWAENRPEWGLARNASFIVAPRNLTRDIDLEGRAFLHSYNWEKDQDGSLLTTILTAPMVVAQWINSQYLFSTLDNVAYGSGSKITQNITGKVGIMQGNGSDFMHGLSMQSVFCSDKKAYHQPLRLMTVVYAPRKLISNIISQQKVLQKLFGNEWVTLACIEPESSDVYYLTRDFVWADARHSARACA